MPKKSIEELTSLGDIIRKNMGSGESASYEDICKLEGHSDLTFDDYKEARERATIGADERAVLCSRSASKQNPKLYQQAKEKAAGIAGGFVAWTE